VKFLIDENISPLVAEQLRALGYDVKHVREVGLKGHSDNEIMEYAKREGRSLITLDADFADIRRYPLGTHAGIIRLKLKFAPSTIVIDCLRRLLRQIKDMPLEKGLLVITDGKTYRVRGLQR